MAFGAGNVGIITSGGLTIEPTGSSFTAALNTQKFTLPALLTSATLGKAGNTADITVASAIATSGAITITGGAVALNGALSSTGGNIGITTTALTGASGITIPATKTLTITQSGTSTYASAISGGGSLVKAGAGTLVLSASSGFTGATTISAGTLALGAGGTTGWLTGTSSIAVDGTLQIWRGDDVTFNIPLTGAGTIEVQGAYRTLFNSYLTTTAQTVATNTTVAEIMRRVTGGQFGGANIAGEAAVYQATFDPVANVGRFQVQNWDGQYVKTVFVRLVQNGANVQALVDQASPHTNGTAYTTQFSNLLGQDMATASGMTYSMPLATSVGGSGYGLGRLDITSKTTIADFGAFTGSLRLNTATETGTGGYVYTRTLPGTLELTSGAGSVSSIVNNGLLLLNPSSSMVLGGAISGTGAVAKIGSGVAALTGANTYTGTTTIAAGTLRVGNSGATGTLGTGPVVNNGVLNFARTGVVVTSGVISGAGSLTSATGVVALTGANTYAGGTTITGGDIGIYHNTALGTGSLTIGGADLRFGRAVTTVANSIVLTGATTAKFDMAVEYLIVAGGGSGVDGFGGGGGGGGVLMGSTDVLGTSSYSLVVGNGGASSDRTGPGAGNSGSNSTAFGLTALGGGAGGTYETGAPTTGSSGGGGGANGTAGAAGTNGQGFAGGTGNSSVAIFAGGGGGGAGGAGGDALTSGGAGGQGVSSDITGVLRWYGGGGGGSANGAGLLGGAGGLGGGGGGAGIAGGGAGGQNGVSSALNGGTNLGSAGLSNSGGGGGGGQSSGNGYTGGAGGAGGSGTIVLRYLGGLANGAGMFAVAGTGTAAGYSVVTHNAGGSSQSVSFNPVSATLSGAITGTGAFTANATGGTLTFTGAASYVGQTTFASGTINVGDSGATGSLAGGAIVNNATLIFNRTGTLNVTGDISGTGSIQKRSTGTVILEGAVSHTGTTTVSGGTLQIGAGSTSGSLAGNVLNNATLSFNRSDDYTYAGVISGTGSVTKLGAGTLTFTGANTYSWTTISAGTLQLGAGGTTGWVSSGISNDATLVFNRSDDITYSSSIGGTGTVTKLGAGTLTYASSHTYSGGTTITAGTLQVGAGATVGSLPVSGDVVNNATLTFNRSDNLTYSRVLSGTGAVTKLGAGTLSFSANNTYSGGTTISAGILQVGNGGATGAVGSGAIVNDASLVFNHTGTLNVTGAISGTGSLSKLSTSTGNVILEGAVTHTGGTTVGGGTLQIGAGGTTGSIAGNIVVSSATNTLSFNRSDDTTYEGVISGGGKLTKLGAGTLTLTGTNTYTGGATISAGTLQVGAGGTAGSVTGGIVNNAALTFNRSDDLTFAGVISGTGTLTKLAAGVLTLAGANTHSGGTTISAGTLQVGDGGTVGSLSGNIDNNAALIFNRSSPLTYAGVISGTGTVTKLGAGTLTLTGANTYAGITTISAGMVRVGAGGATGALGAGAITNNASLVFNLTGTVTVAVEISGTGTLEQAGTGTTVLGAVNTYSGATTVSAGTLAITDAAGLGTTAAGTTVASTGTLDLRGVVLGAEALTLNGGTLATSTGTSSLSSAVTLGAASTLSVGGTQLTLDGVISGASFGLTKTGAGLAILTGVNTYSGDIVVSAGTLRIGGAATLGSGTYVGAISVSAGATFNYASSADQTFGTAVSSGNVTNASSNTLRGNGRHSFSGGGTVTLSGDFSANGTIEVSQAVTMNGGTNNANSGLGFASGIAINNGGTLTLAGGANSFTGNGASAPLVIRTGGKLTTSGASGQTFHLGATTFSGGELATGPGATESQWGIFNFSRAITATEDSTISASYSVPFLSGGTNVNIAAGKTLTVSGTLIDPTTGTDTGLIVNSTAGNTGTLLLTGVNTYAGTTRISGGTLKVDGAGSLGSGTYPSAVINDGALVVNTSANQTFSAPITGTGSVTQSGAGTTTLTATNTYTGSTTVSAGVLQVGNGGTTGALAAASAVSIASGATLRFHRIDTSVFAIAHAVSGDGTLELKGSGANGVSWFRLTGANTLSASAVILLDRAKLTVETQAELSASLPLVRVLSGGQLFVNRAGTFANPLELGAGSGWKETGGTQLGMLLASSGAAAGAVTLSGNVTLTGDSSMSASANQADLTLSGVVSDGGNAYGFTKLGALKVTLTGANTFTGTTTISAGTVQVGAGGTTGILGGPVVNNAALIFDRSDALTFAPAISGTGTLTKAGANTLTLTGASTYTGSTAVTAGGIVFSRDTAPSTAGFTGAGTVTLESAGAAFTSAVNAYTTAATLTGLTIGKSTNTSVVTLGGASNPTSIAGPVTVYGGSIMAWSVSAAGDILLDADTGSQLAGNFIGLNVAANLSTTAASNGTITLRGRGGDDAAGGQRGVFIQAATVTAGGTGALVIEGVGGAAVGNGNVGVSNNSTLTTASGNLSITGIGGGTGASSQNHGILLTNGMSVRAVAGSVLLDGLAGVGATSQAVNFSTGGAALTIGQASQAGSTTIRGDTLSVSTNNVNLLGSGAIVIEPKGASFGSAVSTAKFVVPSTASAFTLGKADNTAALTVAANISVAGPISVYGGDVTLTGGLAATATGNVLIRSSGVLTIAASRVVSTSGGDIALTAARFVNNGGSGALSAGGTGKTWRVWSTNADPFNVTTGDVAGSLAFDFRQYDASYGVTTVLGTGKGMLYSFAPSLTAAFTSTPTKVYDRTDTATITSAMVTVASGYAGGDGTAVFTVTGATYASRNAGTGQLISFSSAPTVTVQTSAATGSKPAYGYSISGLGSLTGDITPLALTLSGVTAANKVYDRTLAAVVSGGTVTPLAGDTVTVDISGATGAFADANVGNGKTITISGVTLGGSEAGNYSIGQPSGLTADITARPLSVTGVTAANKTYDRALTATLSGGAVSAISGDTVTLVTSGASGVFADWNVGTVKTVTASGYALSGAQAGNYAIVQPTGLAADITALTLAVTGVTATNKVYDRSVTATLSGGSLSVLSGDTVTLDDSGRAGVFADWNVGTSKAITASGYALGGTDAGNYVIAQPTGVTANITALSLTISGATAANKVYDRTLAAVVSGGSVTALSGDTVSLDDSGAAGAFATRIVGTGKAVTVTGYALTGTDAGNYVVVQPTGLTADITARSLAVTGLTPAKTYDRSVSASLSGATVAPISGDVVSVDDAAASGSYADGNVGTGKSVTYVGFALTGADAGNYVVVQPSGVTGDITALTLAVTGVTAANKTYDRSVTATLSGGTVTPISGDTVTLDISSSAGVFADWNVGTAKAVTASGYALGGADAGNYVIAQPTGLSANITALSLAVTGATAANKTYDALLGAVISGGAISAIGGDDVTLATSGRAGAFADKNVANGKSVTVSGYTISGTDAGNYVLVQPTGVTADITALTLNVTGATAANKTYDALLGAVISGGAISALGADTVTLVTSGGAGVFADKNVGTGKAVTVTGYTITGTDAANYALVQPTGVTADITALSLAVTGATAANKTYDTLLTAVISGGTISAIGGDDVTLATAGRAGVFADKNVANGKSVTVSGYTISGNDAANYSLVQPTGVTADITALSLAVTGATAANKTYDALLGAVISGGAISALGGDTVVLDTTNRAGVFADKNVANGKAVTVSGYTISGADAANYSLVQPTGVTADITQLTLNVTGATAANKTYDALLGAVISGGAISALGADTVTLVTSGGAGVFADKNVGTGKAVTVTGYTITGTDAANYALVQPTGVTADITALSLAVTGATAANKTYDALLGTTISGGAISALGADTVTLVTSGRTGAFVDKNVGTGKAVTVTGFTLTGSDAGNYTLVQPTGVTADITALTLAVTGATAATKTYDGLLAAAISGGAISELSGDAVTLVASGSAGVFADKNVGAGKAVTVTGYSLTGADAGNYTLVQPTGVTADITALSLNVTGVTAANKTYDALLGATISGGAISVISGDIVTLEIASRSGVFGDKNVANGKAVTVSGYALSGADAGNYSLVQPTGVTADITALSLAVTGATAANKTYDALLGATISGGAISALGADTVTLDTSGRTGAFVDKNVGTTKTVTVSGYALSGTDAGNYTLVQPTGVTADITALSLNVTGATAANKTYDALLGAVISGGTVSTLGGDTVTLDSTNLAGVFADKNVGTGKAVTVSGFTLTGADAGNYTLVQPTGVTANITALTLNVTGATAANKTYDALLGAVISGGSISTLGGDTVNLVSSGRAGVFADKNVANGKAVTVSGYTITGTDAANYSLVQPTGVTADITALSLAVTGATAANKTYDALLGATISGGAISALGGDTVTLDTTNRAGAFADKNVGTTKTVTVSGYALTGADAGNYTLVQPTGVTADITALSLNVTGATAANKTYDALLGAVISGGAISEISGDTVTLVTSGSAGVFADKNVGTSKAVTVTGYTITGTDAANYSLVQPTGVTADITALSLVVTGATAANKTYDALLGATISGGAISALGSDTVNLVTSGRAGVFVDKNVGTSKSVTVSGYVLSGADAANYSLVQPTGITADITALSLAVTGATAANKTYDRNVTATLSGGVIAPIAGDTVTLDSSAASGVFADWNVGTSKAVTAAGYALTGADAGNYAIVQPTGITADIVAMYLAVIGATASHKVYDRSTSVGVSGGALYPYAGDTVTLDSSAASGVFADWNVGTGKTVTASGYSLSGADAGNYVIVQPTGLTANITPLALNVTDATAANKVYDALLGATISGGAISPLSGDLVTLDASARAGLFGDKHVGTGKAVTVSGYALTGTDAGNYSLAQPSGVTADITPLSLVVTGATPANKTYDRTVAATLSGGSISPIGSDVVTLDGSAAAGVFADWHVGSSKAVTAAGYVLTGADAGNYAIVQPAGLTADITALSLAVSGVAAANKTYDRSVAATLSGGAVSPLSGDIVTLDGSAATGVFGDWNVGASKTVSASGYVLGGTHAANYVIVQPTGVTADITALSLTVAGVTAANKTYDRTVVATLSGGSVAPLSGDMVTLDASASAGAFADWNVGSAKAVSASGYALSGASAGNYSIVQPTGITADITPLALNVSGVTAANKVYDRTVAATLSAGSVTPVAGDVVTLDSSAAAGVFADWNVGNAKAVTAAGYVLGGADAGNYAILQPTGLTAHITPLSLAVSGVTAANKVYDRTVTASLSGGSVTPLGGDSVTLVAGSATGVFADRNVGTTKAVTATGYVLGGANAGNYSITQPTGLTADITPATLRVVVNNDAKFVTTLDPANFNGVSLSGFVVGDSLADVSGSATITRSNGGMDAAGTYAGVLTATGLTAQNYAMSYVPGDFTIVPADRVLVRVASETVVYGTAANPSIQSVQYFKGSTGLITLTRVGATNTFDDGVAGGNGTVTFSVVAAAPLRSAGGNLRVGAYGLGVDAGSLVITGANFNGVPIVAGTLNVTPLAVQVTGVTAANKAFDGNATATVTGGAIASLAGDAVAVSTAGVVAGFADKLVGNGKSVAATGYALSGADASNYQLLQPTSLVANITPRNLSVTGVTALGKVYDGTDAVTISGGAISVLGSDIVNLDVSGATGVFTNKHVGTAKNITVAGYVISGADAGNYALVQPTDVTADITPLSLLVTGVTAANKVYDRTLAAILSGGSVSALAGDSVTLDVSAATGAFVSRTVGTAKSVTASGYALTGADAANYAIVQPSGMTADISVRSLQVTGVQVASRTPNGSLTATLTGGTIASIAGDAVTLDRTFVLGAFLDEVVGTNKPVTASGFALSGLDSSNYSILQPTGLTGSITEAVRDDSMILYPNIQPMPAVALPTATTVAWVPAGSAAPSVASTRAGVQLKVSVMPIAQGSEVLPIGQMFSISTAKPTSLQKVSLEVVVGFVPGQTTLEVSVPEGLSVTVDNAKGVIDITGVAAAPNYERLLRTVTLRTANGRQVNKLTLKVGLTDEVGSSQTRVVELRRGDVAANK